ncbi:hypothetical protein ACFXPA_39555 [Amycolatopsis sp. NPDC059090]|uniref:hypothetical protein n=1 Tax=unclassified Amycolatopsis TaxID=2618356 RepID=UPI00366A5821
MRLKPLIEPGSAIGKAFAGAAAQRRFVFFAGLPGVGKSLLIQQFALSAAARARQVHLVRWDVVRTVFESHPAAAPFAEEAGQTHPVIRAAAGAWMRGALRRWHLAHPGPADLLVGETPLLGNRFLAPSRRERDPAEDLLGPESAEFFVPVPSIAVRQGIELARRRDTARPRHALERANADPELLTGLWREIERACAALGIPAGPPGSGYRPEVYAALFGRVLRARRHAVLSIDELLPVEISAQELGKHTRELVPGDGEVASALSEVDERAAETAARDWFLG